MWSERITRCTFRRCSVCGLDIPKNGSRNIVEHFSPFHPLLARRITIVGTTRLCRVTLSIWLSFVTFRRHSRLIKLYDVTELRQNTLLSNKHSADDCPALCLLDELFALNCISGCSKYIQMVAFNAQSVSTCDNPKLLISSYTEKI